MEAVTAVAATTVAAAVAGTKIQTHGAATKAIGATRAHGEIKAGATKAGASRAITKVGDLPISGEATTRVSQAARPSRHSGARIMATTGASSSSQAGASSLRLLQTTISLASKAGMVRVTVRDISPRRSEKDRLAFMDFSFSRNDVFDCCHKILLHG